MTDDDLERALFALPLAEPPAALRRAILAATVDAPRFRLSFADVAVIAAFLMGAIVFTRESVLDAVGAGAFALTHSLTDLTTLGWIAVGVSLTVSLLVFTTPSDRRLTTR